MKLIPCLVALVALAAEAEVRPLVVEGAPFPLTVAEWTPPARDFPITDYGAKPGKAPVTAAISNAIAAAHAAGGGRVVLPKGEWLSGGFTLKSNVALVVPEGTTLRFPDDPVVVYGVPLQPNGRPKATRPGLIDAVGCTNVAILGKGTLKADVNYWHRNFMINPQKGFPRPQFFHFKNCHNIRFEGFKVRGSPAWTMHFSVCEDIVLRDLDSVCTGPNTDGLDLESCNRALVERVSLDQTDDTFTIKSGMNAAGRKRNIPTQNVVIRNCRAVHGHSLLGIGSEVSGGIRNIFMTDCEVVEECWRWLFVKTNAKRGAFVDNITLQNVRGRRASQSVMDVEMYYDGNPNKELTKKDGEQFITRISNITCRNIVCSEAGAAVRVRGDEGLPPVKLLAENIAVGRLRDADGKLVRTNNAPDLVVRDVRLDPAAYGRGLGLPPQMRLCDPARDASADVVVDRTDFQDYSECAALAKVREIRLAAECRTGRNCAPRVEPADRQNLGPVLSDNEAKYLERGMADWGCALPGALVADDVTRVLRADAQGTLAGLPGVSLTLTVDEVEGIAKLRLVNGGTSDFSNVWCIFYAPIHYMTHRQVFALPSVKAGGVVEKMLDLGAGAHYLMRPVGVSPFALQVDLTQAGTRTRLWTTADVPVTCPILLPVDTARAAGPMDPDVADDDTLKALSAAEGPLTDFDTPGGKWRAPAFPGAAWCDVTGPTRPYTPRERGMVVGGRAAEVVALEFEVPPFAKVQMRFTPRAWDPETAIFLNGERLKLSSSSSPELPVKEGRNRLVARFASRKGERKACAQLVVYTWSVTDHLPCRPLKTVPVPAVPPVSAASFPLEWNIGNDTAVPYEVEISRTKLNRLVGVPAACGFTVTAADAKGATTSLPVTLLPARAEGTVRLRFTVPAGTVTLAAQAAGAATSADANLISDNLFAGATADVAKWEPTPRMKVTADPAGGIRFAARDWGAPQATFTAAVPPAWRGKGVVFEAVVQNVSSQYMGRVLRVEQLDATGAKIAESVVDRRWTAHLCPPGVEQHYLEEGRLHHEAAQVRLLVQVNASSRQYDLYGRVRSLAERRDPTTLPAHRLTRLSLRPAAVLPFPKYDDAAFTAGVSGEPGDAALVLGGEKERAFWYQTRSNASWSDSKQLRDERLVFFPSQAGTVEAWFKSDWRPVTSTEGKKTICLPYTLFDAYHGFKATEHQSGVGSLMTLTYRPDPGVLHLFFREPTDKKLTWETEAPVQLTPNAWSHVALQWTPCGTAEVFVDGHKVLTLPIPGWKGADLADKSIRIVNDISAHELFIGSAYKSAREPPKLKDYLPLFEGAVDLVRVSTGTRYAADFTPARKMMLDENTRAFFDFNRSFDGLSSGGLGWMPGTYRALADRVDHTLVVDGRAYAYWPAKPTIDNDPRCVFDIVNYPKLPTPADFEAMRRPFTECATLKPGETFTFTAPKDCVTEYVEIANTSTEPLVWPILLNAGDVDPRSFGDIKDTLGVVGLSPRERADRVFQYVLSASDYYPQHTAKFSPGSDRPYDVEYDCLTTLNGYCGFECGPMNHLAANLLAAVADCPTSGTGGYAHAFQQVFFEGKNHIYDVSAQKFFPAMDNETSAYLKEAGDQTGMFHRYGMTGDHFIRKSDRGFWLLGLADVPKVGVTLNPGESFRVWQVNDGNGNDLIAESKTGPWRGYPSKEKPDMDVETHADTEKWAIRQTNRFFPHFLNGFLSYAGKVTAQNPAFTAVTPTSFCYRVASGYPIVAGDYAAKLADGSCAPLEISTDDGKSFRPLAVPATYAVRARFAYLVRVKAAAEQVTQFTARTEVQINPRTFPGRIHAGEKNVYTLKAEKGGAARVTVAGRMPVKRVTVKGAAYSGTVIGCERLFTAFDSAKTRELTVEGLSPKATVSFRGNVTGELQGAKLLLKAKDAAQSGFGAAILTDDGAEKEITVYTGPGVRFATADNAKISGSLTAFRAPDATSPQRRVLFKGHCGGNTEAAFHFDPAPAGKYAVFNLNRFIAHPEPKAPTDLRMIWKGQKRESFGCGSPRNNDINFWKANYARPGDRANFKWDYGPKVIDVPASDTIRMFSWRKDHVEVAAVFVVPEPTREGRAEIMKILCGLNADPWRMARDW